MKYIRTGDGKLFEYNADFVKKFQLVWWQKELIEKNEGKFYLDGEIVVYKVADTIEELCDEFVFIDEFFKRKHRLAYSLENALARCKYHDVDITTLRGAIWTDKGLIYVAKMNSEGELELL